MTNGATERLRDEIRMLMASAAIDQPEGLDADIREALTEERRATVERIRAALLDDDPAFLDPADVRAKLDAEAER